MEENLNNNEPLYTENPKLNQTWFAVYTKPRHEKKAAEFLRQKGIEVFLPLDKNIRKWSDRKKVVEEPLIRGYLFVHIVLSQSLVVLETHGIIRFIMFQGEYAPIPEFQINALKNAIELGAKLTPSEYYCQGQMVEVVSGPFKGNIGKICNIKNETKFIIALDAVQAAYEIGSIEINPEDLKPYKKSSKDAKIFIPLGVKK